jgi:hypothetical protein
VPPYLAKRHLFLKTQPNVYELEDELFDELGLRKPKEWPLDLLLAAAPSWVFVGVWTVTKERVSELPAQFGVSLLVTALCLGGVYLGHVKRSRNRPV